MTKFDKPAVVDEHYDLTDDGKQSLDHYLTDDTIVGLLERTWRGSLSKDFYKVLESKIPVVKDPIFSRPYPFVASYMLGYPRVRGLNWFEDDADQATKRAKKYIYKYCNKSVL